MTEEFWASYKKKKELSGENSMLKGVSNWPLWFFHDFCLNLAYKIYVLFEIDQQTDAIRSD